ncbi:MAG: hypothetical protein NTZ09_04150 [Candidatus Hydrogenedentes bacterium]|nr:hypothetical protein [Candidatus Hydrogenedentota bacterium]
MEQKCPGRANGGNIEATPVMCGNCGMALEIFSDEVRVHCRCGQWVYREVVPLCAQWCPEAERCFGAAGSFKKSFGEACNMADKEEQERRLKELQVRIHLAHSHCTRPENLARPTRDPEKA